MIVLDLAGAPRIFFGTMSFLRTLGKFLISTGVGVLLFVAWTLWGTGLYTAQQQDRLSHEYARLAPFAASAAEPGHEETAAGPPAGYLPAPGEPVFRLRIPKINLSIMVVEGVGEEQLQLGPGHYPQCRTGFPKPLCTTWHEVWPGQAGRVIVSGHRTTYLHPFYNLNELTPGDHVYVDTRWGKFTYVVTRLEVVQPDTKKVVVQSGKPQMVLTTCNPRYSASQRLVAFTKLAGK